jgi:hypothetical protein
LRSWVLLALARIVTPRLCNKRAACRLQSARGIAAKEPRPRCLGREGRGRFTREASLFSRPRQRADGLFQRFGLGAYLTANGVTVHWLYQPAERYWLFQSIEAVILTTLALALVLIAVWLVRRSPA